MRETEYHNGRDERHADGRRFEWSGDTSLSIAVVEAVASVTGRDPLEIEPLNKYVDPDALDAIFGSDGRSPRGRISFPLEDHLVVVDAGGEIRVYPQRDTADRG